MYRICGQPGRLQGRGISPHLQGARTTLSGVQKQQMGNPIPLPLRATSGDIIVLFEQEKGTPALATLYPLLPGRPPERNDPINASKAGSTLALLDSALEALPEIQPPDEFQPLPTFGELAHWHPLVPDPLAAVGQLPIDREQSKQIRTLLTKVIESVGGLYARLPQQLLHRDCDPGNILMDDQHVTAVLDFEFAGTDIRVLDVCVGLSWWPIYLMGTGKEWELIDAFGTAYMTDFPLREEELLAMPDVLRLRDATSLVHRIGRYLAGLETDIHMQDRVKHSLWREDWLSANQGRLLHHAVAWV
jgi:homoserine kinase type II